MLERLRLREGWSSLILLLLALLTMAWSFEAGGLAEGLHILPEVAVLGALVGFLGAKARLPGLLAHPLGLAVGALLCFLLVSSLLVVPSGAGAMGAHPAGLLQRLEVKGQIVAQRLQDWLSAAQQGESSADPLPFVVQMAAVTWLVAFYGAWFLFRSHWVWGAILPGGLAVFLSVYYAPPRYIIYFILFLLWALILVVRSNVYRREREWQRHHVVYDLHIGLDFLRDGALLSLMVVALVWLVPRPNAPGKLGDFFQRLEGPWQRVQQEWSRLYASLSYREQSGATAFGRTVTLGGAINLGSTPIMEVSADEARYWRAVVLDRYTGSGWADTSRESLQLGAGMPLTDWSGLRARKVLVQTVRLLRAGESLLFAAAEPLQLQVPARVYGTEPPGGEEPAVGGRFEVSAMYAQRLERQRRYAVRSLVSTASVRALQGAGDEYPGWIRERYLQMPGAVPARVHTLARRVAGQEPTPYDQAVAIETYLRGLRYNQAIAAPPAGWDAVDWFLFESQEGYCTYFASAMVLMCRSIGIPARFAQGYAPGEYDAQKLAFVVREADAHAWPEVYFPGYGWIEFEPTPSQPPIYRALGEDAPGPGAGSDLPGGPGEPEEDFGRDLLPPEGDLSLPVAMPRTLFERLPWVEVAAIFVLSAAAVGTAWRYGRRWKALRPVERLYLRLTWIAAPLGVSAHPRQTPFEFGHSLAEALGPRGDLAWQIVQLYTRERFGQRGASDEELSRATAAWRQLRLAAVSRTLRRRLGGRG